MVFIVYLRTGPTFKGVPIPPIVKLPYVAQGQDNGSLGPRRSGLGEMTKARQHQSLSSQDFRSF